jgi:hypothetical protein
MKDSESTMPQLTKRTNGQPLQRDMKIGLFIPHDIDLIYLNVGIATLEQLEKFGLNVKYALNQTCCGPTHVDVEATLVHGAQGARSLNVFFVLRHWFGMNLVLHRGNLDLLGGDQ